MKDVARKTRRKIWPFQIAEDEAVSPVIATILMVAVTVILATTVYILVSHYTSPTPLIGSITEESFGTNTTTLMLNLATPSKLSNPSEFHMQVINGSDKPTGVGWTVENVTITNPDGTVLYMNTFTSSGDTWSSNGAIPANGATNIQSQAIIYIVFHSSGAPVKLSGLQIDITYNGYTGSVTGTLS